MRFHTTILVLTLVLLVPILALRAQESPQQGSGAAQGPYTPETGRSAVPAGRGFSPAQSDDAYAVAQEQPDTHALAGAEMVGLGSLRLTRNTLDLGLSLNESGGNTGYLSGASQSSVGSLTMFSGTMKLDHAWSHYQLTGFYYGGDSYDSAAATGQRENWYQVFGLEQVISLRRWVLRLRDNFLASPQAFFGGQGLGGPGVLGQWTPQAGLGTIASSFGPGSTILTGYAMRLDNTALAEVDYSISRRATFSLSGSYDFTHFLSSGYIDSDVRNAQAGFSYSITPKNSIAFDLAYSDYKYSGTRQKTESDMFNIRFSRRITGRTAFQLQAGPTLVRTYNNLAGSSQNWTWNLSTALQREMRRADYSISYSHGTTSGSGVFFGAQTDTLAASATRRLSKFWTWTVNAGDARNSSAFSAASSASRFNTWYAGMNFGHQMGRHLDLGFNYGAQEQSTNSSSCPVTSCAGTGLTQIAGISLSWHPRTIGIE